MNNIYIPIKTRVVSVSDETSDVKTFELRLDNSKKESFDFLPGQFLEVSYFGYGEAPFCISSSPTKREAFDITVRAVGMVTKGLHTLKVGDIVGIRGPLGNNFPFDTIKGRDILFIGGGIGLPPLRSLINYMFDNRADYGNITILYGARTPGDRVYKQELIRWSQKEDIIFMETVDVADESWKGSTGVVTTLFKKVQMDPAKTTAFTCGPPIMIKFVIQDLLKLGFKPENIITTLERYMKCGIGKCGHCAIGHKYICVDGPVFSFDQIQALPENP
jgi:sulfhydrogenase subunit gamma (sulfur reductase)